MRILHLNLKKQYFNEIKSGNKKFEYRLASPYWKKRIVGREFDKIVLYSGYPRKDDRSRRITRRWAGYQIKIIRHDFFGPKPVEVFSIRVN